MALAKRMAAIVGVLALVAAPAPAAPAEEIAVIYEGDVAPYRILVEGFEEACSSGVRLIPPEEAGEVGFEERLQKEGVRAILAVGLRARSAVESVRRLPVLLMMAPQTEGWVARQSNRRGIAMALSPRGHLETIHRVFPRARRVGIIYDPAQSGDYVREARTPADELGLELVVREIAKPGELSRRLDELRGRADVLWLLPDPTVLQAENLNTLLLASFETRLPLYGFARKYVELGAVAAMHLDPAALGAQAARLLSCHGDVAPVQSAARWEYADGARLVVNQKVARKMGLELDPALLESADDVLR